MRMVRVISGAKQSSTRLIMETTMDLYDRIIHPDLLVRRINITACNLVPESDAREQESFRQMNLLQIMQRRQKKTGHWKKNTRCRKLCWR